jgi:two-component system OmpR family response regulator
MVEPLVRILLVEDDPDLRVIASLALIDIGRFVLTSCASGAEALAVLEAARPQLVLLDLMMPDMDGVMTLAEIRRLSLAPQPVAVFITAKVQARDSQRYLNLGVAEIIPKPFDPITLAEQLRTIWLRVASG